MFNYVSKLLAIALFSEAAFATREEAEGVDMTESGMDRAVGDRLADSYCSFYIGNTRIVYPLFDKKYDQQPADVLQQLFPDKEIVGVNAREILLGGGSVHYTTQQVPKF